VENRNSFTIERNVGRLVEVRIVAPLSAEDLKQFPLRFLKVVGQGRVVSCADLRGINLLAPGMSDEFAENLRRDNTRVVRSAFLVPNATINLQIIRVTREAGGATRRVFDDPLALHQWLAEVLTPDEAKRLGLFLSG
jgi:hypothetical protein